MGSFGVDIDLRFNTASALKDYKEFTAKAKEMMKEVAAGVEGSEKKLEKLQSDFARSMISNTTRQGRALESSIKSLERQAELAGKTYSQQLLLRQEKWIKALGEDEAAVKRVTAAFQQLIKVEEEEERKRKAGHSGNTSLLLRGARDIFEGRMTYGAMDIGRAGLNMMRGGGGGAAGGAAGAAAGGAGLLSGISTTTLVVGGATLAFLGFEAAGYKAAKSMGEYGRQIREVQGVTGMTAVEVQQLEIAAKISGRTVEDMVHGMRGLTQALAGGGSQAEKASKDLQRMGVDAVGLRLGLVSTSEAFEQMGGALEKNKDTFESNLELMDIFKKSGLNIKEMLKDYKEAKEAASSVHLFTEDEVKQMDEMHKNFAKFGVQVDNTFQRLKFWLAQEFTADINLVVTVKNAAGKVIAPVMAANDATARFNENILRDIGVMDFDRPKQVMLGVPGANATQILKEHVESRSAQFKQMMADQGSSTLEGAEQKLHTLEKDRHDMLEDTVDNEAKFVRSRETYLNNLQQVTAELEKQKAIVEKLREDETDRKNIAEALRRAGMMAEQRKENPFALPAEAELDRNLRLRGLNPNGPEAAKFKALYGDQIAFERQQRAAKFGTEMLGVQDTTQRELARARLGGIEPVSIRELGQGGTTRADVEHDIVEQYQQRVELASKIRGIEMDSINSRVIDARDEVALEQQRRDLVAVAGREEVAQAEATMAIKRQAAELAKRERDLARQHAETMAQIALGEQEQSIRHDADLARKVAGLRFKGDNPAAAIAEEYRIAREEAQKIYELETAEERKAVLEKRISVAKAEEEQAKAVATLHRADEAAREDAQFKLAQMQQQQLDSIKSKVEPLYHTLFTDPHNFGKQLRSTVQEAALHPLVSGLSEMTATALHPLIYGAGGTGGIAGSLGGIFGGGHKFSDLTLLPDKSVPVTLVADQTGGGGGGPIGGGPLGMPSSGGGLGARFRRYLVNPPGADDAVLGEIRQRESSGNYSAQNKGSTASGAYQFINSTWQEAARATGAGQQYKSAKDAPPFIQDLNARWLLQKYGPNSTASWAASAPPGGYGGGGGVAPDLTGGMPTFSTTVYGRADVDAASSGMPSALTDTGGGGGGYGGGGGGGGTVASNLAALAVASAMGGGTAGRGGGFNGAGLLGMGKGLLQNWRNLLGQSKPAVWGETPGQDSLNRVGGSGMGGFSFKGLATSPLAKAGAGTVGMMLAQQGLLGNARGTGMGVLEGTLGGAGVGFSMGGPLGAAIGAGVGLGVGLGEMIAGVESPRNEAKRLVQSIYHIGINNTTADQIVNMANSSYGGRVSLAVRSPEVRHMLGLYAAGTGQGSIFAQSANEAHGASLIQSGGVLSQQATYQYGQAFSQSSSLPVYGGTPTHVLGAPGGGMNLSLNIGGQDAAKFLQGNVVSPDVVQTQYAAAMSGSSGRIGQALMMSEPGSIAS